MGDILENKQLHDEEKAKLYNQVLQLYLTYYDQRKGQPLHVKVMSPKTTETPMPNQLRTQNLQKKLLQIILFQQQ